MHGVVPILVGVVSFFHLFRWQWRCRPAQHIYSFQLTFKTLFYANLYTCFGSFENVGVVDGFALRSRGCSVVLVSTGLGDGFAIGLAPDVDSADGFVCICCANGLYSKPNQIYNMKCHSEKIFAGTILAVNYTSVIQCSIFNWNVRWSICVHQSIFQINISNNA